MADVLTSPRPSKRRRISSSATEMQSAILDPGSVKINVSGAYIINHEEGSNPSSGSSSPEDGSTTAEPEFEHDKRDIRLPNHTTAVSHVAADIGGSLAKVVYFSPEAGREAAGGRLHFLKFETLRIDACIEFLKGLQSQQRSRMSKGKKTPKLCVMATGGGAFKYYDRIKERLGVDVIREDEMECLIRGLDFFITEIPKEVFTYNDTVLDNPMSYLEEQPEVYPYLLVNIGSGVSMIKVEGPARYQRIGGTSLGGGTLWGLLSLLTGARTFDEMLALSEKGDNAAVDLLVGDIYGAGMGYEKIGLSEKTIASSFGKVFKLKRAAERDAEDGGCLSNGDKENGKALDKAEHHESKRRAEIGDGRMFKNEDISRSLLYAVSNNIGQIAYLQSEKHNLQRIYFGGSFISGHQQTIHTLSFAIKFWSKGEKQAYFLRHEGYLGAVGAFLKRQPANWGRRGSVDVDTAVDEDGL